MPSDTKVVYYKKELAKLQDASLPYSHRYFIIYELTSKAALSFGNEVKEFCDAGGVQVMVDIALSDWPEDGKLAASTAATDVVEVMHHPDGPPDIDSQSGDVPRSLRRTAINMLAEMANYELYVQNMEKAGLFAPQAVPRMLEQSLALIDWPLHNKGSTYFDAQDQSQAVAVNLLSMAANSMIYSPKLRNHVAEHTALRICALYRDPYSQFVGKAMKQRAVEKVKLQAQKLSEMAIERQLTKLKIKQHKWEDQKYDSSVYAKVMTGGVHYYFIRFFNILCQFASTDQLLRLIHEGGLLSKLRGTGYRARPSLSMDGPNMAILKLTDIWTEKCFVLSTQMYARIQEDEARSLELRLEGNSAFRSGQWKEALESYWKAAALNPEDSSLFNNISLAYARLGDHQQALFAAEESLKIDPAVSKSWARLGDAYRMAERWQLAHLAYTTALELAPMDAELLTRQSDARSHLAEVWDIDRDVPDLLKTFLEDPQRVFDWLGITRDILRRMPTSDPEALFEKIAHYRQGHSRNVASALLKERIQHARAAAVATGLVRASSLPASCQKLQQIRELPQEMGNWTISWTDTPLRHKKTGLVRHILTVYSGNDCRASVHVLGTPGVRAVSRLMISGMIEPMFGRPCRPPSLFVAHRMFPILSKVAELLKPWGIDVVAETAAEAQTSAAHNDTEWSGYNHAGEYRDEEDDYDYFVALDKDYKNGHLVNNPKK